MTPYRDQIVAAARRYDLDPNLLEALVIHESQGCADAFRFEEGYWRTYLRDNARYKRLIPRRVSSSYGLCQVMYPTAQQYGFHGEPELLFLPVTNLDLGAHILADLLKAQHGDARRALEAYNGGPGHVDGTGADAQYAVLVLKIKASLDQVYAHG